MSKNIVLLSDGTGNSSAKLFKTNVWRIYQALDLKHTDTIAFYDDGVGTDRFAPLALLGGAVGLGLAQNVRDLYAFLCRNYRDGDRIYAFGFSRGAFTIRTLVGLITSQGLVSGKTDAALRSAVELAYRRHRRVFRTNWQLWFGRKPQPMAPLGPVPEIQFLGLWDTVAAYGLPIDELQRGIDRYLFPLTFPDRELSPKVHRACHALALDDERRTFHPVLWTEAEPESRERIEQVWFAGAHSDVGGGYPDETLSYVSLAWMMRKAARAGLRFRAGKLEEFTELADPHGELHDSRSGLASYYRYAPRRLATLCRDDYVEVRVDRPKIHESVFERIRESRVPYAPLGIPSDYDVVRSEDDAVVPLADYERYETAARAAKRAGRDREAGGQEGVWDAVWFRRLLYFASLAASLFLVVFPWLWRAEPASSCRDGWPCVLTSYVLDPAAALAPSWASFWLHAYRVSPLAFLAGLMSLWLVVKLSNRTATRIFDECARTWAHARPDATEAPPYAPSLLYRIRSSNALARPYLWVARSVAPLAFALLLLVAGALFVGQIGSDVARAIRAPEGHEVIGRARAQP